MALASSTIDALVFDVTIILDVFEDANKVSVSSAASCDLLQSGSYSDFTIEARGEDGNLVAIRVHKCIFLPRWTHLEKMLNSGLNEEEANE